MPKPSGGKRSAGRKAPRASASRTGAKAKVPVRSSAKKPAKAPVRRTTTSRAAAPKRASVQRSAPKASVARGTPVKRPAAKRSAPAQRTRERAPAKRPADRRPAPQQPRRLDPALPPLPFALESELHQTAARGRSDEAKAAMQRALAAFDRGELGKAAGEGRRAKEAAPRSPSVREALGLIYHARKDFKEALSELQAFRRISGSPLQDSMIADCYRELGRPEKALEVVMSLQRESVDEQAWIEAQVIRARAHESRGNLDAAIGVLRSLDADLQISEGNHLRARYELAELLERAGQRHEARVLFAKIAVKAPGYRDALARAR